jgi:hypothetical protein
VGACRCRERQGRVLLHEAAVGGKPPLGAVRLASEKQCKRLHWRPVEVSMPADPHYVPPQVAPMPDSAGLIQFLRAMVDNPAASIPRAAYREPVVAPAFARSTLAFVSDPDLLEEILVRRVADFPKSLVDERIFRPAFGDGLLLAEGESWRWKRRLATPFLAPAALAFRLLPGSGEPRTNRVALTLSPR